MSKLSVPFSPPDITDAEINAVVETLKSGWITTGPKTKEFEKKIAEYVGAARAVCLNSATAALELGLRLFEIGEGDEVIILVGIQLHSRAGLVHHLVVHHRGSG